MECSCSNYRSSSSLQLSLKPSFTFLKSNKLNFSKLKPQNTVQQRLVIRSACGFDENGTPFGPKKLFMLEAIGAEYGEGFETFRQDGPLKVDVDFMNDKLQEGFLQRIRYAMKPDEQYGLIFSWDNVVADTRTLKLNAWKQLALEEGKEIPEDVRVQKLMLCRGADQIIHKATLKKTYCRFKVMYPLDGAYFKVLHWEKSDTEVEKLKSKLSQLYHDNLLRLTEPVDGLKEWLAAVSKVNIPCTVASSLDLRTMVDALDRMGIKHYFQAMVAEEDGMESIAHRFLSAAMKLDRKPSKCVVFEDDPRGVTAAHNCTMMAVALIGTHPAYDLVQADLAVASFNELSVINLRRLFANKGSSFMDRQKQMIEKAPPRRKLTIDTI